MPSPAEFDQSCPLFDEAVAAYEAAKEEFDVLQMRIRLQLGTDLGPTTAEFIQEEQARARLYIARVRLTRHERPH
jgi:hypothetical protein